MARQPPSFLFFIFKQMPHVSLSIFLSFSRLTHVFTPFVQSKQTTNRSSRRRGCHRRTSLCNLRPSGTATEEVTTATTTNEERHQKRRRRRGSQCLPLRRRRPLLLPQRRTSSRGPRTCPKGPSAPSRTESLSLRAPWRSSAEAGDDEEEEEAPSSCLATAAAGRCALFFCWSSRAAKKAQQRRRKAGAGQQQHRRPLVLHLPLPRSRA